MHTEDVNEVSEMCRERREFTQKKRRSNLAASTAMLTGAGLSFQSNNGGIHLVLLKNEQFIDFWPSTGLWWIRGTSNKRRGIQKLIKYMKVAS
jgi:hypothetical protein